MSRNQLSLTVVTWLVAFAGGAWTMLLLLASAMRSGTGLIRLSDLLWMLPFAIPGIVSALILLWQAKRGRPFHFMFWLVPLLASGIPFVLVVIELIDQIQKQHGA